MAELTKAQAELLLELPTHVVPEYRPAQALLRLGLAEWKDDWSTYMQLTDEGETRRLALHEARAGERDE